ncbi:MAG TPA: hypothetical protein VFQ54_01150, partial [Thermomicrobiales bacterium]|nr:hypothetical protein [Thermomicrobiales bacterium]
MSHTEFPPLRVTSRLARLRTRFAASTGRRRSDRRMHAGGRAIHGVSAIVLVLGLFLPMYAAGNVAASPQSSSPVDPSAQDSNTVIAAPSQVSITGDFGQFDLTSYDGVWKGVFAVQPGQYNYQFVVT